MIDLKYHIYSLVAVFIAFGIGTLVGVSLGGGIGGHTDAITRQSAAIQRLRSEFKNYDVRIANQQSAIDDLTNDLKEADALISPILPTLLKDALSGRGVAIVQLGGGDELTGTIKKGLQTAGALVNSVTRIDPKYDFGDQEHVKKAARLVPLEFQDPSKEAYQQLWGYVASVLASGRSGKPMETLMGAGVLQADGQYGRPSRYIVLVAPSDGDPQLVVDLMARPLVEKLKANKVGLVVASSSVKPGDTPAENPWAQLDVPTVSHADTSFGQISLAEALSSGEGHYGLTGAEELVPRRFYPR